MTNTKIGSSYSMKKLPVLSKCQQPSGTTPSRCSPKHSPFFFPNVCCLRAQRTAMIPSRLSMPSFRFPSLLFLSHFFSLGILFLGQRADLFKTQCCVLGKNLPFVKLKGLWLVWQWRLAGQLVNNLKQDTDQGILQTSVLPRRI